MPDGEITRDSPAAADVRALLARHLEFTAAASPPEDMHALDAGRLADPAIEFFSFRSNGVLLSVGALKRLDDGHAELKSMHTRAAYRGQGVGRAVLGHLIGVARARGYRRVSLETGTMAEFAPARALYASAGFRPCPPFGDYRPSRNSAFMTLDLSQALAPGRS